MKTFDSIVEDQMLIFDTPKEITESFKNLDYDSRVKVVDLWLGYLIQVGNPVRWPFIMWYTQKFYPNRSDILPDEFPPNGVNLESEKT